MRRPSVTIAAVLGLLLAGIAASRAVSKSPAEPVVGARAAAGPPSGATAAKPLLVNVFVVQPETLAVSVPATGTLLARESVALVSELSRRLKKIRAVEGAAVAKGAVLFELDVADLQAELARLEVQLRVAKTSVDRQAALLQEQLTTEIEWEAAVARYDELEAQRRVLAVSLDKALIRAPFAGTVGLRNVSEGAWVSPDTVLTTLHDTSRLKLDFTLPERYAGLLAQGRRFQFTVEGRAEPVSATVQAFETAIDAASRSVVVRGLVENVNDLLPGTFARLDVPLTAEQALMIPSIAVIPGAEGRSVFIEKEGTAHSVAVEIGARQAARVQVLTGLQAGDRVITSNLLRLKEGTHVSSRDAL
jgi:membrane fusion protein, multidrug efflux system